MSERDRPCQWCQGIGNLRGGDCGLCSGTGLTGYSVGDNPVKEWESIERRHIDCYNQIMEQVIQCLTKKKFP